MPAITGGLFAINRDYFYEVSNYDEGMDICSGEDIYMSSPKYQWLHEGEVKFYFRYLEIEKLDYSDLCCHQPHQRGGYLTYCVRGLSLKFDIGHMYIRLRHHTASTEIQCPKFRCEPKISLTESLPVGINVGFGSLWVFGQKFCRCESRTPKFPEMHFGHFLVQYFGILPLPLDVKKLPFLKGIPKSSGLDHNDCRSS